MLIMTIVDPRLSTIPRRIDGGRTRRKKGTPPMKTPMQWWTTVKSDDKLLNDWLLRQYRGEVTAASRIEHFRDRYACKANAFRAQAKRILTTIASQERQHAAWVLDLLHARGITPDIEGAEERYWKETLPSVESFETGAAVGAHAEEMRLLRIRTIVEDDTAPEDIRDVFKRILKDEEFHARAFRDMAGEEAMSKTAGAHERGMALLGLVA